MLAFLRRRLDDRQDDYRGWTPPVTVAQAVGAGVAAVLDEFHVLAADGEVNLNETIGGFQTMAKINSRGIARLAQLAKAKRAAATRPAIAPKAVSETYRYDAFVSHASEDA